jgi:hypothetical protein
MIKNDRELAVAKKEVEQIIASNNSNALIQKLQREIAEYEALVAHNPENPILLEVDSEEQIPELPVKASIAFKISSQELERICESDEQDANAASDLINMMRVLGIQLIDELFFVAQMSSELKQKLEFLRVG